VLNEAADEVRLSFLTLRHRQFFITLSLKSCAKWSRNPKLEIRNKFKTLNSNDQKKDVTTVSIFVHSDFGFVSDFGFRVLDLIPALPG